MKLRLLILLLSLVCCSVMWADKQEEINQLEAEMLKYFGTNERSAFFRVTKKLKNACMEAGEERLYFRTCSYLAIFEANHQNYSQALEIVQDILNEAWEKGSTYGEYTAIHTEAMILLKKQDYDAAEKTFLNAVDFHHRRFPNESAGDDLLELLKIADYRKDYSSVASYARQIMNETNVTSLHKYSALYHLCQIAFEENNVEKYNLAFNELMLLKGNNEIGRFNPIVEVNYSIINGDFEQALRLADKLEPSECAERKAIIYHRMGDDSNAFKYMQLYKQFSDSIILASHNDVLASYYVQMNDDRMRLEQNELEKENHRLLNRLYLALAILLLIFLLFFIWKISRHVRILQSDNTQLLYERKDAERALTDLNELSFFESKTDLPLTLSFRPNEVCDRLTASAQAHCRQGVALLFQTEMEDDYEFLTNSDALKKLLVHLLNYSVRFTYKGMIRLSCLDAGENIRFVVTDTSEGLGGHVIGMFAEQGHKVRYVGMNFNICQSITRLLHGRIWHDTEYTNGTRFCFEIPKVP